MSARREARDAGPSARRRARVLVTAPVDGEMPRCLEVGSVEVWCADQYAKSPKGSIPAYRSAKTRSIGAWRWWSITRGGMDPATAACRSFSLGWKSDMPADELRALRAEASALVDLAREEGAEVDERY